MLKVEDKDGLIKMVRESLSVCMDIVAGIVGKSEAQRKTVVAEQELEIAKTIRQYLMTHKAIT